MRIDSRQIKKYIKLAKSEGLTDFSLVNGTFSLSFKVGELMQQTPQKVKKLSKEDKEKLQKIEEQAKIDEMMINDPVAYEEYVATGQLQDVEGEDAGQ